MGPRHLQILGYRSYIRPHLQTCRSMLSLGPYGFWRQKITRWNLRQCSYSRIPISACFSYYQHNLSMDFTIIPHQSRPLNMEKLTIQKPNHPGGPRITDGAGDNSSANWTIPQSKDHFKSLRQKWIKRILQTKSHIKVTDACKLHQSDPFLTDEDILPFIQDIRDTFTSMNLDFSISPHQPFRLKLLLSLLLISEDPDANIATLLQEGIPSGAFSQLQPVGLREPNTKTPSDYPDLIVCQDNSTSANHDPTVTRQLIQKELDTDSLRKSLISKQLKNDGPEVSLWENWVLYMQTTEIRD